MPVMYCQYCDKIIDLDCDVEHFDDNENCQLEKDLELEKDDDGHEVDRQQWLAEQAENNKVDQEDSYFNRGN